jgi:PDZ domain-containing protein
MTRRAVTLLSGIVLLVALVLLAGHVSLKDTYVELVPGPTYDTLGSNDGKPLITITGAATSNPHGQLRMLTVGEIDDVQVYDIVRGWLDPTTAVIPAEITNPNHQTQQQQNTDETDQMQESQDSAISVALRHLGYPAKVTVQQVLADKPASGHLAANDVIDSVDGQKVVSAGALLNDIQGKKVGTTLQIGYIRDGKPGQTAITTVAGPDGQPQIGVQIKEVFPVTVNISLDNVGGPSAGMMFTLAIIDKLSTVDLTGGNIIAGTGTIDYNGNVGAIGGIQEKMVAAKNAGARYFLAPADNCAEALGKQQPGMTLIKVTNLDSALTALEEIRDGKPTTPCTSQ